MREDFLVVKLAHQCSRCGEFLCGRRWECRHVDCVRSAGFNRPSPFALCEECFVLEGQRPLHLQHGGGGSTSRNGNNSSTPEIQLAAPVRDDFLVLGCARSTTRAKSSNKIASHELHLVDEGVQFAKAPAWDPDFRNPLMETRHAFLSLCTGNRYAFSELRRAKHTTEMILYHLHNPDAPAHLYTCNICKMDILAGCRFHCTECNQGDFDLCQQCADTKNHIHQLVAIEVTKGVDVEEAEAGRRQFLLEQRRVRLESLNVFLRALVHASGCADADCVEPACKKMKQLLDHRTKCTVRVRGGCEVCRRVLCLVQMHAKACKEEKCAVPHCEDLKRHMRAQQEEAAANKAAQLQQRQQGRGRKRAANEVVMVPAGELKIKLKLPPPPPQGEDGASSAKKPKQEGGGGEVVG
jgi:hypothetical protein